jgi:hypothetical protein
MEIEEHSREEQGEIVDEDEATDPKKASSKNRSAIYEYCWAPSVWSYEFKASSIRSMQTQAMENRALSSSLVAWPRLVDEESPSSHAITFFIP